MNYSANELAIVVPTRNRPHLLVNLLNALKQQTLKPAQIVIVASGDDIQKTIDVYTDVLNITYQHTLAKGQINQKKEGLSLLNEGVRLVVFFDDDIIPDANTIEELLKTWNAHPDAAGVGLEIKNSGFSERPTFKTKLGIFLKSLFFLDGFHRGGVLASGVNVPYYASSAGKTNWLNGGSSSYRRKILEKYMMKKENDPSNWAVGEDLRFSFELSHKYELLFCRDAKVLHHDTDVRVQRDPLKVTEKEVLARYKFVVENNLSAIAYLWSLIGLSGMYLVQGKGSLSAKVSVLFFEILFKGKRSLDRFNSINV